MKGRRKSPANKGPSTTLPEPYSGRAMEDLMWDCVSPLAPLICDDLRSETPEAFWATVSGAAIFHASARNADAARRAFENTSAPLLRRVRHVIWRYRLEKSTQYAMLLWSALLAEASKEHPSASDGQLFVLIRRRLEALARQVWEVEADGR